MKKLVVWFIGGNSVGKTTQARELHENLAKLMGEEIEPVCVTETLEDGTKLKYTVFSEYSANLGDLTTNACGGTDTLNSKRQIQLSFEKALNLVPVVVVEGIMATGQWINFLKRDDTVVFLVYLRLSHKENIKRLKERRAVKKGCKVSEVDISDKTKDNIQQKLNSFRSLFKRMKEECDYSTELNGAGFAFDIADVVVTKTIDIIASVG